MLMPLLNFQRLGTPVTVQKDAQFLLDTLSLKFREEVNLLRDQEKWIRTESALRALVQGCTPNHREKDSLRELKSALGMALTANSDRRLEVRRDKEDQNGQIADHLARQMARARVMAKLATTQPERFERFKELVKKRGNARRPAEIQAINQAVDEELGFPGTSEWDRNRTKILLGEMEEYVGEQTRFLGELLRRALNLCEALGIEPQQDKGPASP
jgi:hypothetical protein